MNGKKYFSYADKRWSNGELYNNLGFEFVSETSPNYWYVKGIKRICRYSLRKKNNEENITEMKLRKKEGYKIIWDCGNLKFRKINTKYINYLQQIL